MSPIRSDGNSGRFAYHVATAILLNTDGVLSVTAEGENNRIAQWRYPL